MKATGLIWYCEERKAHLGVKTHRQRKGFLLERRKRKKKRKGEDWMITGIVADTG